MLYKVRIAGLLRATNVEANSPEKAALKRGEDLPASAWTGGNVMILTVEGDRADQVEFHLRAERKIVFA